MVRIEGCVPHNLRFVLHYEYAKASAKARHATRLFSEASDRLNGCDNQMIRVNLDGMETFSARLYLDDTPDDLPF